MRKNCFFGSLFFSLILFSACVPEINASREKKNLDCKYTKALSVNIKPCGTSTETLTDRSALPSIPQQLEDLDWQFVLTENSNSQTFVFSSQELQKNNGAFTIPVSMGNWSLSAESRYFEGSVSSIHIEEDGYYDVELPVYFIEEGTGTVSLKIDTGDSGITKLLVTGAENFDSTYNSLNEYFYTDSSGYISISRENIPSETYNIILNFFVGETCILSLPKIINIRKNCITDKWFDESLGELEEFCLSKEEIRKMRGSVFYVKGSNSTLPSYTSSENTIPDGSFAAPFSTVQEAIDVINHINDETTKYTVFIDGIIINTSTNQQNESFINICSEKPLKLELHGLSSNAIIDATGNENRLNRIMNISGNVQVEIKNLSLTGGYTLEDGGGIYISTPIREAQDSVIQNLILSDNTKVYGNYSEKSGGGLYIENGAVLITGNTEISDNSSNLKGGGICILGDSDKKARILTMEEVVIKNNISLSPSGKISSGGGLYTQFCTAYINNCQISENTAAYGGGITIAQNTNITISNTSISANTATHANGKGGGAIFASGVSSNLYLKDGCIITGNVSNSSSSKGGGISITTTKVHVTDSVIVEDNYYTEPSTNNLLISNISLAEGKILTIDGSLYDARLGITLLETPVPGTPITFTKNYTKKNPNLPPDTFFFSDDEALTVSLSDAGEAELVSLN